MLSREKTLLLEPTRMRNMNSLAWQPPKGGCPATGGTTALAPSVAPRSFATVLFVGPTEGDCAGARCPRALAACATDSLAVAELCFEAVAGVLESFVGGTPQSR